MGLAVVKVGGSLAMYPQSLRTLCTKLVSLSKAHVFVVVPGGGEFADTVRTLDKRFSLSGSASHRMAILAMDQYGLMLSDLHAEFVVVSELRDVETALGNRKIPVFLPSKLLFKVDPLENSWHVTSDSIALYIAAQLKAQKLLLVTDVDGVYTSDPHKDQEANLLRHINPAALSEVSMRTSVDAALPKLLLQYPLECYVVNGLFSERIEAVLKGQDTVCTFISDKPL